MGVSLPHAAFSCVGVALWAAAAVLIARRVCVTRGGSLGIFVPLGMVLAAVSGIGAYLVAPQSHALAIGLLFATLPVVIWIDIRELLIFEALTYPTLVAILVATVIGGGTIGDAVLGAVLVAVPLALVNLVTHGGTGWGDVALGLDIGAAFGASHALSALEAAFIFGGIVGGVLAIMKHRKFAAPFAPVLGVGALFTLLRLFFASG